MIGAGTSSTEDPDLARVIANELRLHQPGVRHSPASAGALLDPDFREFGASGRIWDRRSILDMMAADDAPPPTSVADMQATRLAADVILLTYRSLRPGRTVLRSSIWRRGNASDWQVIFHQATPQPGAPVR